MRLGAPSRAVSRWRRRGLPDGAPSTSAGTRLGIRVEEDYPGSVTWRARQQCSIDCLPERIL